MASESNNTPAAFSLDAGLINAQSAMKKITKIKTYLEKNENMKFLAVTETWCREQGEIGENAIKTNCCPENPEYGVKQHNPRMDAERGGGVALIYKKKMLKLMKQDILLLIGHSNILI